MSEKEYLTKEKYEQLQAELHELEIVKRKEIAEHLEYARSLGDLSENAEYHDARTAQAEIESRIEQIQYYLKNAEIIKPHKSETVEVGSTVKIKKEKESEITEYQIVGTEETDMLARKISHQSPMGHALLGKKSGEKFSFKTPKGISNYVVVSIS
jgi:transcription elongation factor GreA